RGRIRIHEDDAVAFLAERARGLSAGIVEFRCLADDDRAGANDQDAMQIGAFGHELPSASHRSTALRSESTIMLTSSGKDTRGVQPSRVRASVASATRSGTSLVRTIAGSTVTNSR